MAVWTKHAELSAAVRPFGVCLAAHLAACARGSGVFAWLCAGKYVLAQLQAKELENGVADCRGPFFLTGRKTYVILPFRIAVVIQR